MADSTLGVPQRSSVCNTWRCKFERSTLSSSTRPSVPGNEADKSEFDDDDIYQWTDEEKQGRNAVDPGRGLMYSPVRPSPLKKEVR